MAMQWASAEQSGVGKSAMHLATTRASEGLSKSATSRSPQRCSNRHVSSDLNSSSQQATSGCQTTNHKGSAMFSHLLGFLVFDTASSAAHPQHVRAHGHTQVLRLPVRQHTTSPAHRARAVVYQQLQSKPMKVANFLQHGLDLVKRLIAQQEWVVRVKCRQAQHAIERVCNTIS